MAANSVKKPDKGMRHVWQRGRTRRIIAYTVFSVLLIIAISVLGEEIEHNISSIEIWMSDVGLLGVLVYIVIFMLLTSAFLPDTVMSITAGALFGLKSGIIAVFAGALAGSAFQYYLGRRILRRPIERLVTSKPSLASIRKAVVQQGLRLQILLRMTPVSPVMVSYLLGASGVRFSAFMIACCGLLPTLFAEVYSGYAGRHIARMAGRSEFSIAVHDIMIVGGLISTVIVLIGISRKARKAIETAASRG